MQNVVSKDDQLMCFESALLTKIKLFLQLHLMVVWHLKRKHCQFSPERKIQQLFILHERGSIFCRGCEKRQPSHHFYLTFGFRKDNQQRKKQQKYNNKAEVEHFAGANSPSEAWV